MRESGRRVLVFGLDQRLALYLVDVLTEDGYEFTIADSRPAALNLARSASPDVILVDLALSVCSCGWNLITELRSNQDTSRIPLLVVSDTQKCREDANVHVTGCHQMIAPYDIDDLVNSIAAAAEGLLLCGRSHFSGSSETTCG